MVIVKIESNNKGDHLAQRAPEGLPKAKEEDAADDKVKGDKRVDELKKKGRLEANDIGELRQGKMKCLTFHRAEVGFICATREGAGNRLRRQLQRCILCVQGGKNRRASHINA